jgi:hypothetical protein
MVALVRNDPQINFAFPGGAPDRSVSRYNFSARYLGSFTFAAGTYTFAATVSDGFRLYIDGRLVLDKWVDQEPTTYHVSQNLTAGQHSITLEFYTRTGTPSAALTWTKN